MIIETIFSTLDENGRPNFAPMGVEWGEELLTVRPYRNTRTYLNLISSGYGVANLSDNALAFVKCGLYKEVLPNFPAKIIPGAIFYEACSWREMEVISEHRSGERAEVQCLVLHRGRKKDFTGFCRAANAVIEAAILATRFFLYNRETMEEKLNYYMNIIEKTGSNDEKRAFEMVREYVGSAMALKEGRLDDRG
jgi:hypothetical protein